MGGCRHGVQLDPQFVYPDGNWLVKRDEGWRRVQITPFNIGPDPSRGWERRLQDFLAATRMAQNRRVRQQAIAMRMVAMMVRIDQGANRLVSNLPNCFEIIARASLSGRGIDRHHAVAAYQKTGVIEKPATIRLHVGENAGRDLLNAGRSEGGVVAVR